MQVNKWQECNYRKDKKGQIAASAGIYSVLAVKLEQILTGPNDRAFIICAFLD